MKGNPHRIMDLLSMIAGEKILPGETLIIFDEIQECPEALNTPCASQNAVIGRMDM